MIAELGVKEAKAAAAAQESNETAMGKAFAAALKGNPPVSVKLKRVNGPTYRDGYVYDEQKIETYEQALLRPINLAMCGELAHALGEAPSDAPLVISVNGKQMMVDGHISIEPIDGCVVLKIEAPKEKASKRAKEAK